MWVPGLIEIEPVYLTKELPAQGESMYTKGFPKCRAFPGSNIEQVVRLQNGTQLWYPNAISGQSGSGVWGDNDNLQKCLLTWSIRYNGREYGAGQLTNEIWKQNRDFELGLRTPRGFARRPDWDYVELTEGDYELDFDREGLNNPVKEEGYFENKELIKELSIQSFPIWAEDQIVDPVDPVDPEDPTDPQPPHNENWRRRAIADMRRDVETLESRIASYEKQDNPIDASDDQLIGDTFGL